jgi:tetratricopeptide (TPR) repeat protein
MLNVIELENRWRKYKVKSYIPYISVLFIIIFVLILVVFFIQPQKNKELHNLEVVKKDKVKVIKKPTLQIEKKEVKLIALSKEVKKQDVKNKQAVKKIVLSPSLNFISSIKYSSNEKFIYKEPKKVLLEKKQTIQKKKTNIQEKVVREKTKEIHKNNIKIKRRNTQKDISEVMKRFQKNHNPALSLFVAKKYYELGDYRQSYNYALITNSINDEIEVSWIIFAKSLVKLNKKDEAIKTLRRYISHTHSNQAQMLLEDIISGKFR